MERALIGRLLGEVNGAEVLGGMIYGTSAEGEVVVKAEEGRVAVIGKEAAVVESHIAAATALNELELAIAEEVTGIESDGSGPAQLHDAVGAVAYDGAIYIQQFGVHDIEAVCAAAVEVAVLNVVGKTAFHAYDASGAVASLAVADGEVVDDAA